jgi:3(or 17)beta-hydroxysteroid dehydrogenase
MSRLKSKICVVTGAASGIGRAIAEAFKKEGAVVVITDRNEQQGMRAAAELDCQFELLDVREERDWERFAQLFPTVDVVVNNAGVMGFEDGARNYDPENMTLEDWRAVHQVNVDGMFLGCRYAIRAMKNRGEGSIINVSSRYANVGLPPAAAYAASKAEVAIHTKSVALYCAQKGWKIRCNSIHPGAVRTPIWDNVFGSGPDRVKRLEALVTGIPLGRFARPEEIAAVAVMLASDDAPYMTGSELAIDGGASAGTIAGRYQG